jgi:hypothetical protein
MKKINFDIVFKIVVIVLLSLILAICYSNTNNSHEPSEIGRYKELENGKILDTQTGVVNDQY